MAIIHAIICFKYYVYGIKFITRCDNAAITKLTNSVSEGDRVTRWITFLNNYQYTFVLIKSQEKYGRGCTF